MRVSLNAVSFVSIVALCWLASGCAAPLRFTSSYCAPPERHYVMDWGGGEQELSGQATREERLATLLGLSAELARRKLGELADTDKLRILARLELARLEVGAIKAEVDCEGERAKQALEYLTQRREKAVQGLTVASILAASAVGVASVVLAVRDVPSGGQIGVGAVGAGAVAALGLQSLYVSPTVLLRYDRNLLTDIWTGPRSSEIYPPIVWAYLTHAAFSNEGGASTREKLIARFCAAGDGCVDEHKRALIFDGGGDFDVETLRMRAALLDKLKVEIDLAHQSFESLSERLLR